jgi:FMN-dependent NADH-azoreductase
MKKLLIILGFSFWVASVSAQEMNCIVSVTAQQLEGTDKKVFETLQNAIYEFINNRKWTSYNFRVEERIECTMLITVNQRLSADEFSGNINLVLRRPILNSAYNSVLLNYIDKGFQFRYTEFQPLDYNDGTFTSNLTSVLAFYTYMYLGLYFDSFSLNGGQAFLVKAQEVVTAAQNASEPGWKAFDGTRNRYWMAENFLNPSNSALTDFYYKFHRLGLDQMYEKVDAGRENCSQSLDGIKTLFDAKPELFAIQLLTDAKRDEFVNIYADQRVPPSEKATVVNIFKEIDPANGSKYQAILDNK